ncbi:hypothetical protein X750_29320 [Mesorhizobium sp. LNJC394B00]|nr:hypothetical protein X750_29320 [Mesorhizobium sp. LNJC394B00]
MTSQATTIDRRHLLVGLASLPVIAGATALPVAVAALTLQQKADAVWRAAEALSHAMTDLNDHPCTILPGSNGDCIVVMLHFERGEAS